MASTVQVTWIGPGLRLVAQGSHGPAVVVDHVLPDEERLEGGPRPMELLLIGLAGCTTMDVVSILQKKRQAIDRVETQVTAERAQEHPRVYTSIHLTYVVAGRDVEPQAVARSIELSETKYCGAMAMLRQSAEITTSYQIVDEDE